MISVVSWDDVDVNVAINLNLNLNYMFEIFPTFLLDGCHFLNTVSYYQGIYMHNIVSLLQIRFHFMLYYDSL
jgi:hypothetical protein